MSRSHPALIAAIETPDNQDAYRKDLLQYFDVDGSFQVLLMTCEGLDSMDTVERKKLSYRIQVYLEDITHNGSFFYYNSDFVLVAKCAFGRVFVSSCRGCHKKRKKTYARTAIVRGNREQMYGYFPAFGKLSEG